MTSLNLVSVTATSSGLTIATTSQVVELRDGRIRTYTVDPGELGLTLAPG